MNKSSQIYYISVYSTGIPKILNSIDNSHTLFFNFQKRKTSFGIKHWIFQSIKALIVWNPPIKIKSSLTVSISQIMARETKGQI